MKSAPLLISMLLVFILLSCNKRNSKYSSAATFPTSVYNNTNEDQGEMLAQMYCATCHQYPEPSLLDKNTWKEFILPRMGYMYGIYKDSTEREALFEQNEGGEIVRQRNLFPKRQRMHDTIWEAITNFYLKKAPESITPPKNKNITKDLAQFKPIFPQQKVPMPSSTFVDFSDRGTLYLGDAATKSFSEFSTDLQLLNTGNVQEGAVSLYEGEDDCWLTVMGSFSPTDAPKGFIATLPKNKGESSVPIKDLQRPVHSSYGDIDNDGDTDIIVCEFGKWTGGLSLFRNVGNGRYSKSTLLPTPGAIKAYLRDMDSDGDLDVVALFAQGDEGIDIFYNYGEGQFERKRVLNFHPSMGSSFFDLIDYNNDGHLDILYTAGDNADYAPVMKPWHGVYVYLNDGENTFSEELFLHLNGAYNAVVNDFDGDGDSDIAAISFFPDWQNTPEEGFVYFKNEGNSFSQHTFPEVNKGRWVVMDASDYDKDGDVDLVLGSLAFEVVPKMGYVEKWIEEGIPFVVLQNTQN